MQNFEREAAERVIAGHEITKEEALGLAGAPDLDRLLAGADAIRISASGNRFTLCSVMNVRSGNCSEDCRYCAQSAHYSTAADIYGFADEDAIVAAAKALEDGGVHKFSLVASGRGLAERDTARICSAFSRLSRETNLHLCASLGIIDEAKARLLKEAGCTTFHHNLETSRRFFPEICTTHTFDERLQTIRAVRRAGLQVCSGGILGLGETMEDRIDMAFDLRQLDIRSVPLNVLVPIPGTPLENVAEIPVTEILRTMAVFRFILPAATIIYAGGRSRLGEHQARGLRGGINAAITGNMLTTTGSTLENDLRLLSETEYLI